MKKFAFVLFISILYKFVEAQSDVYAIKCAAGPSGTFIGDVYCHENLTGDTLITAKVELLPGGLYVPFPNHDIPVVDSHLPGAFCFVVSSCLATRQDAKKFCESYVGMLIRLDSEVQRKNVEEITAIASPLPRMYFTDIVAADSGRWVWESSEEDVPTSIVPPHTFQDPTGISLAYSREWGIANLKPINNTELGYFMCQQFPPECVKKIDTQQLKESGFQLPAGSKVQAQDYTVSKCKAGHFIARKICYEYQRQMSDLVAVEETDEAQLVANLISNIMPNFQNFSFWTSGTPSRGDKKEDVFFVSTGKTNSFKSLVDNATADDAGVVFNAFKTTSPLKPVDYRLYTVDPDQPQFFVCEDCATNSDDDKCTYAGLNDMQGEETYGDQPPRNSSNGGSTFKITARVTSGMCHQMGTYRKTGQIPPRISAKTSPPVPAEKCGFYRKKQSNCDGGSCFTFTKGPCGKNNK